jgi:hypothetical protein
MDSNLNLKCLKDGAMTTDTCVLKLPNINRAEEKILPSTTLNTENLLQLICNKMFVAELDKHFIQAYFNSNIQQISSNSFIYNRNDIYSSV